MSVETGERSDAVLLDLVCKGGSEIDIAFRELVARHGPMVLGVCRRLLSNAHEAEDAFQATFLVLARRASDAPKVALGVWLYGVARRVALKAHVANRRRVVRERRAAEMRPNDSAPIEPTDDLKKVIDEELERLPEPLRAAVVLCYLYGMSRREVAEQLGCPESTLSSRLAQARELLAARLSRRGITAGLAGLIVAVPATLLTETASAAANVAAGNLANVSPAVLALADEGTISLAWLPKWIAGLLVAMSVSFSIGMSLNADPSAPPPASISQDIKRWYDPFDGQFALDWKPLRPDPSHVSLTKHPGTLTITTQRGTIYGASKATPARNIYLIDQPLPVGAEFTVTTRIINFQPMEPYQQAGIILYEDDDHYLKYVYEHEWTLPGMIGRDGLQSVAGVAITATQPRSECFAFVHEYGSDVWNTHASAPMRINAVWLRVTFQAGRYVYSYSLDGQHFVVQGSTVWAGVPRRLGLVAKNVGVIAPEIDAQFDFFELKTP